jgi:hypothetical protein
MSKLILDLSLKLFEAEEGIKSAQRNLSESKELRETTMRSITGVIKSKTEEICAARLLSSAQKTDMVPSIEHLVVERIADGLHVRFIDALQPSGIPHKQGTVPIAAGQILNHIGDELRKYLAEEGLALERVICTLPDHWWRQDELANEPIY